MAGQTRAEKVTEQRLGLGQVPNKSQPAVAGQSTGEPNKPCHAAFEVASASGFPLLCDDET